MGKIPGAYTQAFCFEEFMDDDAESDDEAEMLRQGMVAVKFSKEFKQEIRRPWVRALIVKVYGRNVGLNFFQARLLSLWKPAGRLDVVDLEHGFFLIRFSLKEDVENVLKKGPWFLGDHFLSVRPWEPDFKPESAKVSSIAVWIRLSGLPIEYYNAKALQHIGKAIGNVPMPPCEEAEVGGASDRGASTNVVHDADNAEVDNRRNWVGVEKIDGSNGLNRETKRKLSPLRILEKAQVEQVLHRIGKEAQVGSAHNAGMKTKAPKSDKAHKASSVKGIKVEARARAGYKISIDAAGEENIKDRSPSHKMGQAGAIAGAKLSKVTVVHLNASSPDGDFLFAAIAVSKMGQV
uniref:DUF4283 domain-containing protein n=1 Tax=Quercus lobata TaxID=97700 RepID=A0A7N2KY10_QUELO